MKKSRGPVILLVVLSLVLFFILGVRYGQKVEQTNKRISTLLTTTPPQQSKPTTPLTYKTFASQNCGLSFVYPSSLSILKNQPESVSFSNDQENAALAFSCERNNPFEKLQMEKVASEEIQFQQKPVSAKSAQLNGQKYLFFSLRNPVNAKSVYLIVENSLYPLIEGSLQFRTITSPE